MECAPPDSRPLLFAGARCSLLAAAACMQVLGCSALQSIDDGDAKETTDSLPSLCVCSAPLPHTHTHTHTHTCAHRPCPAQPTSLFGRAHGRISVKPRPLRAYPPTGAWSRRPLSTPSTRITIILRHCCTRASASFPNRRPRYGCSPALAPDPRALAGSPVYSAALVACQPCLMALGAAADWTASPLYSCTHPFE